MTYRFRLVTYVLVAVLSLSARPDSAERPARQADLDAAITKALGQEDAARQTIARLLHRDDVRKMATGYRLALRPAEAAVATLQGDELQRLSGIAATADARLSGGDDTLGTIAGVMLLTLVAFVIYFAASGGIKE